MQTITFECEVITPMFLAGADGTTPELRAPSIKGALRFWWRAMNGGNPNMKEDEEYLFGGTNNGGRRSRVMIRILDPLPNVSVKNENLPFVPKISTYYKSGRMKQKRDGSWFKMESFSISMLDYLTIGIREDNGSNLKRGFIKPNEKFYLEFRVHKSDKEAVINAFVALSQFGSLGSKNRNGFGCFSINKMAIDKVDMTIPILKLDDLAIGNKSDFTAFSKDTSIVKTIKMPSNQNNWYSTIAELGKIYQKARETVEAGGVAGWHDYRKRQLLTAPIIVGKGTSAQKSFLDRHAKPYFLHVSKNNNQFIGTILCIPYNFLAEHPTYDGVYNTDYDRAIVDFNSKLK